MCLCAAAAMYILVHIMWQRTGEKEEKKRNEKKRKERIQIYSPG
jgi:hypothetical protein